MKIAVAVYTIHTAYTVDPPISISNPCRSLNIPLLTVPSMTMSYHSEDNRDAYGSIF